MQKIWILLIFILISAGYLAGIYTVHNHTFPYSNLRLLYNQITFDENEKEYNVDVKSLIHINSVEDIQKTRAKLIDYIWSSNGLPNRLPDSIEDNYIDKRYENLKNLKEIKKIEIIMDYGINSISYFFIPQEFNNQVIVYHQGHSGDFINGVNTIQYFLSNGYSVLAFSMPLLGMNDQPYIVSDQFGVIHLTTHSYLQFLEDEKLAPIQFFVEPIFVSLNYLEQNYVFDSYHMVGLSGGGWTTVIYPAIDTRISQSYSVAGSYPLYLRSDKKLSGDYEQIVPDLYQIANYLDFYTINSYGENRKFVQIFNKYDSCCFSGFAYQSYESDLTEKIQSLQPSNFKIFLDESHAEHKISNNALEFIIQELET